MTTPKIQSLDTLEGTVAALTLERLLARYRDCVTGGHVWRPLDASEIGVGRAEFCGWCLRVRIGTTFEGWLLADTCSLPSQP
jgi:hypothetical protein